MDSITQFVLGAAVSTACLGKKLGPRKAAIVGGILGTVPDLDVLIPFDDPIDSFVYHRGWTHSIFVHVLATPLIGEALRWIFKDLRDHRWLIWITVFLCLSTHAMIDAMTVYGTRLFWPFYSDPIGIGSIFIIDPVYSLPLLIIVIWALCKKNWTSRLRNWVAGVLAFTTAYMGLSVAVQNYVELHAREAFQDQGLQVDDVWAIAAPLNILVWKVIGLTENQYDNLYYSLLDEAGPPEIYVHRRHTELVSCLENTDAFRKLDWFSRGFFRADLVGGRVVVSDLRMGLTPGYVFQFAIGEYDGTKVRPITPERQIDSNRVEAGDWDWFLARLQGLPSIRKAEALSQTASQAATSIERCDTVGSVSR